MEIISRQDAIHKEKPDGTRVDYYLQPEYELHYNEIPAGTTQEWHSHNIVEELIFMIDGSLEIKWLENEKERKETVQKGDLIRVEDSLHTFANINDKTAIFIVIKLVLSGKDNSKIFKNDRQSLQILEH
jgi:quercetin dioxygenase-like cupin family protein